MILYYIIKVVCNVFLSLFGVKVDQNVPENSASQLSQGSKRQKAWFIHAFCLNPVGLPGITARDLTAAVVGVTRFDDLGDFEGTGAGGTAG